MRRHQNLTLAGKDLILKGRYLYTTCVLMQVSQMNATQDVADKGDNKDKSSISLSAYKPFFR